LSFRLAEHSGADNPTLPAILTPGIANALYVCGHGLIFSGIRRHTRGKPGYKVTVTVTVVTLLAHWVPGVAQSISMRIILFYFLVLMLLAASVFSIQHYRRRHPKYGFSPLLLILGLFFLQLLARQFVLLFELSGIHINTGPSMIQARTLFVMLYIMAASMSFAYLINWEREQALHIASHTDSLTQWQNRRALMHIMHIAPQLFTQALTRKQDFSMMVVDVDYFKAVNDTYGHSIGDKVLQYITQQLQHTAPRARFYCRLGGEEFALIFTHCTLTAVLETAEKLREHIATSPFNNSVYIPMSVSIGVAVASEPDSSWESVLDRADQALYEAKASGRNKVCLWSPPGPTLS